MGTIGLMGTSAGASGAANMAPAQERITPILQSGNQTTGATTNNTGVTAGASSFDQPSTGTSINSGIVAPNDSGVQQQQTIGNLQQPLGNTNSVASTAVNQGVSQTGIGSSIGNSVNSFGSNVLGLGSPLSSSVATSGEDLALSGATESAPGAGELSSIINAGGAGEEAIAEDAGTAGTVGLSGSGAATAGALGSTLTLTGALGDAGIGALAGGFIASALHENPVGGSIGGAIGGVAGGFAAGTALGAALGSFAPVVGTAIGAVLGGVIGGLFGGAKPSDQTEVGGIDLNSGQVNPVYQNQESDTGDKYSSANAAASQALQEGAANLAQYLKANGATATGPAGSENNLVIKIGNRDGDQIGTQTGPNHSLDYTTTLPSGSNTSTLDNAVAQTTLQQYNIPSTLQAKLTPDLLNVFFGTNDIASTGGTSGVPLIGNSGQTSVSTGSNPGTSNIPLV